MINEQTLNLPILSRSLILSRFSQLCLFTAIVILIGGVFTLTWQTHQEQQVSKADTASVVGRTSLPAATVNSIFRQYGSPMAGLGDVVEQQSRATSVDDAFALAVWWTETNDGEAGVGLNNRNPGSVSGGYGFKFYPTYGAAVTEWFSLIKNNYVSQGLTNPYTIGHKYAGDTLWGQKVMTRMLAYRGQAPAPAAPALRPAPVASVSVPTHQPVAIPTFIVPASDQRQAREPFAPRVSHPPVPVSSPIGIFEEIALALIPLGALALGMGLWEFRRRRRQQSTMSAIWPTLSPIPSTRPFWLDTNQYSPMPVTSALRPVAVSREGLPIPALRLPVREQQTGEILRYNEETFSLTREEESTTEALAMPRPFIGIATLPAKVPVSVEANPRGLLSKYSNDQRSS